MQKAVPGPADITTMTPAHRDIVLLFSARLIRLFAYGFVSVVLALYLAATGLSTTGVGAILTATLALMVASFIVGVTVGRKQLSQQGAEPYKKIRGGFF